MPASDDEHAHVLSAAQIEQFIQDGFVSDQAFPKHLAEEGPHYLVAGPALRSR
jgi:hypothetical protein